MKKRLVSLFLVICMVLTMFPMGGGMAYAAEWVINLSAIGGSTEYLSGNGQTARVVGSFAQSRGPYRQITVTGSNNKLILDGITVDATGRNGVGNLYVCPFIDATNASGTLTIELRGSNRIQGAGDYAAIRGGENVVVNFVGDGTLEALGGYNAPAIGGVGCRIVFGMSDNGKVTAVGGHGGAGIGGGRDPGYSRFSEITVNSGEVVATGGGGVEFAPGGSGIGLGSIISSSSNAGTITINGGKVTATGGDGGAGLGGGYGVNDKILEGRVRINGGEVVANGTGGGAGIGGSRGALWNDGYMEGGSGWDVAITNGKVTAKGSGKANQGAAGIGGGCGHQNSWSGETGTIVIAGGTVTATGGEGGNQVGGAGLGSGGYQDESRVGRPAKNSITISGNAVVTATGGGTAAGIGGGTGRNIGNVNFEGGIVKATGGAAGGMGIGGRGLTSRNLDGSPATLSVNVRGGDISGFPGGGNASGLEMPRFYIRGGTVHTTSSGTAPGVDWVILYGGTLYATCSDAAPYAVNHLTQLGGKLVAWNDGPGEAALNDSMLCAGTAFVTAGPGGYQGSHRVAMDTPNFPDATGATVYAYGTPLTGIRGLGIEAPCRPADPSQGNVADYKGGKPFFLPPQAKLTIPAGVELTIPAGEGISLDVGCNWRNEGTVTVLGQLSVNGSLTNAGQMFNRGKISLGGVLENQGVIENTGAIECFPGSSYLGNPLTGDGTYTPPGELQRYDQMTEGAFYYFDLSAELSGKEKLLPGPTIAPSCIYCLGDQTLHYVPFRFMGPITAYRLTEASINNSGSSEYSTLSTRSLFLSQAAIVKFEWSPPSSLWDTDNYCRQLIYGDVPLKNYPNQLTMRSPSGGTAGGELDGHGYFQNASPRTNECDKMFELIRKDPQFKSFGFDLFCSDTFHEAFSSFAVRSLGSYIEVNGVPRPRYLNWTNYPQDCSGYISYTPVLEVNPALPYNRLTPVKIHLNEGRLAAPNYGLTAHEPLSEFNIVAVGDSFLAPPLEGLIAPTGSSTLIWRTATDATGQTYLPGERIPASVTDLYAIWYGSPTPNLQVVFPEEVLGGVLDDGTVYTINGEAVHPSTVLPLDESYFGTTISVVATLPSLPPSTPQLIDVPARQAAPTQFETTAASLGKNDGVIKTQETDLLEYRLGEEAAWQEFPTNRTLTGLAAGTYQVRIMGTQHTSASKQQQVIVAKTMLPALELAVPSLVYDGTPKTPGVTLNDGARIIAASEYRLAYQDNTQVGMATVTVTDQPGGKYILQETSATFQITPAEPPVIQWPTAAPIVYGATLASAALQDGSTNGRFVWTNGDQLPTVENQGYLLTFQPNDVKNYDYSQRVLTQTIPLEVQPKTVSLTWSGYTGLVYTGAAVQVHAVAGQLLAGDSCAVTIEDGAKVAAGHYTAQATALENPNYSLPAVAAQDYDIAPAPVTFLVSENQYIYDTTAKEAAVNQNADEVPVMDKKGFAVSYEQAGAGIQTPTDKGTYDVLVEITDPNFRHATWEESRHKVGDLVIASADYPGPGEITWPTAAPLTYGQTLADSALTAGDQNGTFVWKEKTTVPTVTNSGYLVVFTPKNTNYNPVEAIVPITVCKTAPTLQLPTAAALIYPGNLESSTLSEGGATALVGGTTIDVPGTFTWMEPTLLPLVADSGKTPYGVTFTPKDEANFAVVTGETILVAVNPLPVQLAWDNTAPISYDTQSHQITARVINKAAEDLFTLTYTGNEQVEAGTYTAEVTALGNENYTLAGGSDLTHAWSVAAAAVHFTVAENSHEYNNTAKTAVVAQAIGQTPDVSKFFTVSYQKGADGALLADQTDAGIYGVMVTLNSTNFAFSGKNPDLRTNKVGEMTIQPKPIAAIWQQETQVYDGTPKTPVLRVTGLAGSDSTGDHVTVAMAQEEQQTAAGTYAVTAALAGDRSANYTLTNAAGSLLIQKAPVVFTVTADLVKEDGNPHQATVTANPAVAHTIFYQNAKGEEVAQPTAAGSYGIYGVIAAENYRHNNGADGSAQKIGTLTIYRSAVAPTTYPMLFDGDGGSGEMVPLAALQAGAVRILPQNEFVKDGFSFVGWSLRNRIYLPGETLIQPASNMNLKAVWASNTYGIRGTVQEPAANGVAPAAAALVTLSRGSNQLAQTVTGADGVYAFANVCAGTYTLTVAKNGIVQTGKAIMTADGDLQQNILLPAARTNTVTAVAAGLPSVVVDGLNQIFDQTDDTVYTKEEQSLVAQGGTMEVKLSVNSLTSQADVPIITEKSKQIGLYLDLQLTKTVTNADGTVVTAAAQISQTPALLEVAIALPGDLQKKDEYIIYRVHGDELQILTATPNKEGEYLMVNKEKTMLTLYIKTFSTYAIGYINQRSTPSTNPVVSGSEEGGTILVQNDGSVVIMPDEGYQIAGITVNGSPVAIPATGKLLGYNHTDQIVVTFEKIPAKPVVAIAQFTDVFPGAWYYDGVKYAVEQGLFLGLTDTVFGADQEMSRAMLWSVLYRLAGSPAKTAATLWYGDAQTWVMAQNISDGSNPAGEITREQLVTILYRYAKGGVAQADLSRFTDGATISPFAQESMTWAVAQGILQGDQGKLNPLGHASRGEVAAMLQRYFGKNAQPLEQ